MCWLTVEDMGPGIIPARLAYPRGQCQPWPPACQHHLHPWALPQGPAGAACWERSSPGFHGGRDFVHCGGCLHRRPAPRGARPRAPGHGDGAPAHFDLRGAGAGRPPLVPAGGCRGRRGCGCACAPCRDPAPCPCLSARAACMPGHNFSTCRAEREGVCVLADWGLPRAAALQTGDLCQHNASAGADWTPALVAHETGTDIEASLSSYMNACTAGRPPGSIPVMVVPGAPVCISLSPAAIFTLKANLSGHDAGNQGSARRLAVKTGDVAPGLGRAALELLKCCQQQSKQLWVLASALEWTWQRGQCLVRPCWSSAALLQWSLRPPCLPG